MLSYTNFLFLGVIFIKYVFINPVVDRMYNKSQLDNLLIQNNFIRIGVDKDYHSIVKKKYSDLAYSKNSGVILDKRCPLAVETIKQYISYEKILEHNIHPILIHCAIEIAQRKDLVDNEKFITTPCKSLADYGNNLKLDKIFFVPWNEFLNNYLKNSKNGIESIKLDKSPIPLGYFDDIEVNIKSISGKYDLEYYFKNNLYEKHNIVEMLYCCGGCNNGDGVLDL